MRAWIVVLIVLVVAGLVTLGLYLGGVFDSASAGGSSASGSSASSASGSSASGSSASGSSASSASESSASGSSASSASGSSAGISSAASESVSPQARTRGFEHSDDKILYADKDAGFGKEIIRDADVLVVRSNRKTYQYRGDDLISELEGRYVGKAGVFGKKAKIESEVIYEDAKLVKPIGHDDVYYYFMHDDAVVVYDSDTKKCTDIYRGNKVKDAYLAPESLVVMTEREVLGYLYFENGFELRKSISISGGLCIAQFKEESFLIGFENRVELYNSDFGLVATLRSPEPADSFGASVAFFSGRIYVGAPRERTVYVFCKVDDLWLPYAAYSRDTNNFGAAVEAGPEGVYVGADNRVYVL